MKRLIAIGLFIIFPFLCIAQHNFQRNSTLGFTLSFPWINNYSFYDYELKKSSSKSGFVGLGAALFCKTGKNKISLNFGFTGDLPAPIGAFDYGKGGTRTNIGSIIIEGLYHWKIERKLNVLCGGNFVDYKFHLTSYEDSIPAYTKNDNTIGLTIGTEYLFGRNFALALFYRPAVLSFDNKQYRHLVSLDARFDINMHRK